MLRWLVFLTMVGCPEDTPPPPVETPTEAPREVRKVPQPDPPDPSGAIAYTVSFPEAKGHLFQVDADVAAPGDSVEWMMAVWTPGSYLVREYARHVEDLRVVGADGSPRTVRKTTKNRWVVDTKGTDRIRLSYRVYGREMSVRTNFVDADFAMLNGASTFLVPVDRKDDVASVLIEPAEGWETSVTGLDPHPDGKAHHYLARDYDELVDSPILVGNPTVHDFEVSGVAHHLVNLGGEGRWDHERSAEAVEKIVRTTLEFWDVLPYEHYHFLNVIAETRGGLEHLDSTLMLTSRDVTADDERFESWLGLVSHEFFHTWNVKRMRPQGLGPFDYENEVYTPSLWIAEGVTSYYDDLLLVRAGLLEPDKHLERLSDSIGKLQAKPGRHVQSLTASSHDAWIKYYRSDENSNNTSVSYYRKGSLVAFLLDQELRRRTADRVALDDVMLAVYEKHPDGYTEEQFRAVASEVGGFNLTAWFADHVDGVAELNYTAALRWLGLRFAAVEDEDAKPWLGVELDHGKVKVVPRETPAWDAGLNAGDEILALDGFRIGSDLTPLLDGRAPGETIELLLSRRGKVRTVSLVLGDKPPERWTLEVDTTASSEARIRRERWWGIR